MHYSALSNLWRAKTFLLQEQNHLCAYCQQQLTPESASFEVIPKELNTELSTNYYNLVVVCKSPLMDPTTNKLHCDKEKQSNVITSLLFVSNNGVSLNKNNAWFDAYSDGSILPKHGTSPEHFKQADAFVETLNLNHLILKEARAKDSLDPLIKVSASIPTNKRRRYWESRYQSISANLSQPYRQFLLIYIGKKIGIN